MDPVNHLCFCFSCETIYYFSHETSQPWCAESLPGNATGRWDTGLAAFQQKSQVFFRLCNKVADDRDPVDYFIVNPGSAFHF